jgi:hypothetical protein
MIKHLVIAITLLTGCDGYHWFYACDDPNKPPDTTYCTTDSGGDDTCEGGKVYYVWYVTEDCGHHQDSFCADDDTIAQSYVDSHYSDISHGAPTTDPSGNQGTWTTVCGSNPTDPDACILGSSDETLTTSFYVFNDADIAMCEMALDPGCTTWVPVDPQSGSCPGSM